MTPPSWPNYLALQAGTVFIGLIRRSGESPDVFVRRASHSPHREWRRYAALDIDTMLSRILTLSYAILTSAVALASAPVAGTAQETAPLGKNGLPRALVGCWALFDEHGDPADKSLYWAPAFARLDSSVLGPAHELASGVRRAAYKLDSMRRAPAPTGMTDRLGWAGWIADSLADSVRVTFSSGFSGTEIILALPRNYPAADSMHGRAVEFWDFAPRNAAGRAHAVRVSCGR